MPEPGILRSMVFVAAHDGDAALACAARRPDAVCLDLEDLTPPRMKDRARALWPGIAEDLAAVGVVVFARVNGLSTGRTAADLQAVICAQLTCVNLPKSEDAEQVEQFCHLVDQVERQRGLTPGSIKVRPVIETARGIRNAYEIAAASPRIAYMGGVSGEAWGDLGASLGARPNGDGRESYYLRSKVLVDVRAAGVPFPIGGIAPAADPARIRSFAAENRALGYDGSQCHDNAEEIAIVNEVFTPTDDEIAEWRAALAALMEGARAGEPVVELEDGGRRDVAALPRVLERLALADRLSEASAKRS